LHLSFKIIFIIYHAREFLKTYTIVIYWVSVKDQNQATEHHKENIIEWNGELDIPFEQWIIKEDTENKEITYNGSL